MLRKRRLDNSLTTLSKRRLVQDATDTCPGAKPDLSEDEPLTSRAAKKAVTSGPEAAGDDSSADSSEDEPLTSRAAQKAVTSGPEAAGDDSSADLSEDKPLTSRAAQTAVASGPEAARDDSSADSSEDEPLTSRAAQKAGEVAMAKKVAMEKKPNLYDALRHFRTQRSITLSVPPYCVFQNTVLDAIVATRPHTSKELLALKGVGPKMLADVGAEVLKLVMSLPAPSGNGHASTSRESTGWFPKTKYEKKYGKKWVRKKKHKPKMGATAAGTHSRSRGKKKTPPIIVD